MKRMSFLKCYDVTKEVQKGVEVFCKESGHIAQYQKNSPVHDVSPAKKSRKWVTKIIAVFVTVFKL